MDDYKPNSHRFKEEQTKSVEPAEEKKRVNKVVTGPVRTKKKSDITKFADIFISDDAQNVGSFMLYDMVLPTLKRMLLGALDMALNGGSVGYARGRDRESNITYRPYGRYYDEPRDRGRSRDRDRDGVRTRPRFDYDEIVFDTRGEAEAVLQEMEDALYEYKSVTVADLYDMVDLPVPFTSNKYGWTSLRDSYVKREGDGYVIKLPKAGPID